MLKNVDIGKPSAFVGMEVGKPINIDWADAGDPEDTSVDASDNAIEIQKAGRRIRDEDDFL